MLLIADAWIVTWGLQYRIMRSRLRIRVIATKGLGLMIMSNVLHGRKASETQLSGD